MVSCKIPAVTVLRFKIYILIYFWLFAVRLLRLVFFSSGFGFGRPLLYSAEQKGRAKGAPWPREDLACDHLIPRRRQIFSHNLSPEGNSWVTVYRITIGEVRSPSSAAISSIKYHGKIEYDKQNCLQHEKMQSGRKTRSAGYLLLPLYKNRCITKKFPIKKVLEMMDSGIKNHAKVEYDKQNCVQRETIQSGRKIRTRGYVLLPI